MKSEVTDNQVRIYSDNVALTRWLQGEIEQGLNPDFADEGIAVTEAAFSRHGDVRSFSTERVVSRDSEISLTWYDLGEPFLVRFAPGSIGPTVPHGVYSVITPAARVAAGSKREGPPGGGPSPRSWAGTWVAPAPLPGRRRG